MVQGSSGEFVISGCLAPTPTPCTKKILTGFLRFAWTPLGTSGGPDPWNSPPPASYAAVYCRVNKIGLPVLWRQNTFLWRNIESIPFYSIYGRINLQLEPMGFPV